MSGAKAKPRSSSESRPWVRHAVSGSAAWRSEGSRATGLRTRQPPPAETNQYIQDKRHDAESAQREVSEAIQEPDFLRGGARRKVRIVFIQQPEEEALHVVVGLQYFDRRLKGKFPRQGKGV